MKKRKLTLTLAAMAAGVVVGAAAAAGTVVVSPGHLQGWQPVHDNCGGGASSGFQAFSAGPKRPPLGRGSYKLNVGSNGDSYETIRSNMLDGVRLSSITTLRYST